MTNIDFKIILIVFTSTTFNHSVSQSKSRNSIQINYTTA